MGFFPTLWADNALLAFREKTLISQTVNRDFDGLVKAGAASVEVPTLTSTVAAAPPLTFTDNTKSSVAIPLNIQKAVPIQVKNLDATQSNIQIVNALTADAGAALAEEFDKDILAAICNGTALAAANRKKMAGGALLITLDDFINAQTVLNAAKVPQNDRYCVISANLYGQLFKISDFVTSQYMRDKYEAGVIGQLLGFKIIVSANVPKITPNASFVSNWIFDAVGSSGTKESVLFYYKNAYTAVMQQELNARSVYSPTILADQVTLESIYGVGALRSNAAVITFQN